MKKVLIITYYWPPAGGGGVQRWLKFVKHLPQFGYQPVVVVPENADYPTHDETLLKDIPTEAEIIRIPIWEPYQLFKFITGKKKSDKVNTGFLFDDGKKGIVERLSLWLRGNILIPDPRVFWVRPVVKELSKRIDEIKPEVVITTGPPHSVHLIGQELKKRKKVKWIADFRDPWSTIDYLDFFNLSTFARNQQRRLERKVLQQSNLVLSVSENWKKGLIELGAKNVEVITNGYDEADFKDYKKVKTDRFIFTYTGLITSLRNPKFLWELLEEMLERNLDFAAKFELRLIGNVDAQVLNEIQSKKILATKLNYLGYLQHTEVVKAYSESSMLLLLINQSDNASGHIPGKLFEYLASQTPVLALGEKNGDVGRILNETGYGKIFNHSEVDVISEFILNSFEIDLDIDKLKNYSRKELTRELIRKIENL